jgi:hypothetical protein
MSAKNILPPSDRISASFKQLAESAVLLNAASDELAKAIAPIDAALKKLNLGVSAWHKYAGSLSDFGDFWSHQIGYAKIGGKWGLAICATTGIIGDEELEGDEWLFNDAPRWMRIQAIEHIPELLEDLVKQANKVASDLQNKTEQARELAATITNLSIAVQVRK